MKKVTLTKEQQVFFFMYEKNENARRRINIIEFNKIRFFSLEKIKLFAKKEMFRMAGNYTTVRTYGYRTGYLAFLIFF